MSSRSRISRNSDDKDFNKYLDSLNASGNEGKMQERVASKANMVKELMYVKWAGTGFTLTGVILYFLSRSVLRFKYSEAISYIIMSISIIIYYLLQIAHMFKKMKKGEFKQTGNIFYDFFSLLRFFITGVIGNSLTGALLMVQLLIIIYLTVKHADYFFTTVDFPFEFSMLNILAVCMIMLQTFYYQNQVRDEVTGRPSQGYMTKIIISLVFLAINLIPLAMMWVILEKFRVDG
tara:strand:+ start:5400 stop:6101 length:702 start_codon:yes stop_codon:yes gene_type:complete